MNQKKVYKSYPKEFKEEAVALVTEQGYSVAEYIVDVDFIHKDALKDLITFPETLDKLWQEIGHIDKAAEFIALRELEFY